MTSVLPTARTYILGGVNRGKSASFCAETLFGYTQNPSERPSRDLEDGPADQERKSKIPTNAAARSPKGALLIFPLRPRRLWQEAIAIARMLDDKERELAIALIAKTKDPLWQGQGLSRAEENLIERLLAGRFFVLREPETGEDEDMFYLSIPRPTRRTMALHKAIQIIQIRELSQTESPEPGPRLRRSLLAG